MSCFFENALCSSPTISFNPLSTTSIVRTHPPSIKIASNILPRSNAANMHFTTALSFLLLALNAEATALPRDNQMPVVPVTPFVEERDVSPANPFLNKRACSYNGCKCNSRGQQLTVCGNCVWTDTGKYVVTSKRVNNHIFECSPSGDCCDYGYATDCGSSSGRCRVN